MMDSGGDGIGVVVLFFFEGGCRSVFTIWVPTVLDRISW